MSEAHYMGKEAALDGLAQVADQGYGLQGLCQTVNETINQPMQKQASQQDLDYRMGVESVCYDFLKTANEYYGTYEVTDEQKALEDILIKVAVAQQGLQQMEENAGIRSETNQSSTMGATKGLTEEQQREVAGKINQKGGEKWRNEEGGSPGPGGPGEDPRKGRMQKLVENIKDKGADAAQWAKDNPGKATGVGVGTAALGAGGLYALKKRRDKKKQEEEKAAHQKQAGLQYTENDIATSIDILEDAGLLG